MDGLIPAGPGGIVALPGFDDGVVRLVVGGMLYEGFDDIEVRRSLREMAGQFTIHVTQETSPGMDGPSLLMSRAVKEQDSCQIFYGSVLVLTGNVDAVQPRYSKTHHSVTLQGRSKTGDLADCSVDEEIDGGEMRDVDFPQMARKVTRKFGVEIDDQSGPSHTLDVVRNLPGERVHRFLERYGRLGVALTDNERGDLRLFQSRDGAPVASLIEGVNIEEASAMLRADTRHSKYTAKGQDHGSDAESGRPVAQRRAEARDGAVRRHRPLTLLNEGKSMRRNARGRAAWEAAKRSGESLRAEVKTVGWCHAPGALWMPGLNVQVTSPMLYVDRVLMIENTVLTQSRSKGTIASLSMIPPEAASTKSRGKGGAGSGADGGSDGGNDEAWEHTKPDDEPQEYDP